MIKLIASLTLLIFSINCHIGLPSEAKLTKKFLENKADFYGLATMLNEDDNIVRLSDDYVFYTGPDERTISEERVGEYRQILHKLGIENGIHRDNPRSVRLIASSQGIPIATYSKSYLYSTENPESLVESIDKFVSHRKQSPVYKKLEDNWYLEYESW
ncbi:MAG: hypothetical protein WKF92_05220 [Pyrinomonadaceae bacterium]